MERAKSTDKKVEAKDQEPKSPVKLEGAEVKVTIDPAFSSAALVLYCAGIYASFLSWSYLQEKISSKNYSQRGGDAAFFKATLVINVVQSFFAMLVGTVYLSVKTGQFENPVLYIARNRSLLPQFLTIACSQSLASPVAYLSLNHVDYLFYLLAKSCKLIPVMVVHRIIYGSRFPLFKYLVAATITLGVLVFTLGSSKRKGSSPNDGNTLLGLAQLVASLLLDGYTNSSQDQLFKRARGLTGGHLMAVLNLLNLLLTATYMLIATDQLRQLSQFVAANGPEVLWDIVSFGLLGALGQVFIFLTLERFSSIVLVTVTVTRKMLSMLLSVVLFGHVLRLSQWIGLLLVFAGIFAESATKFVKKQKTS